jgi:vancomycin permeability regulator SanA
MKKYLSWFLRYTLVFLMILVIFPFGLVLKEKKKIYQNSEDVQIQSVGIVFGAGLTPQNTPSDVLMDRLKVAADLYQQGKVSSLLVSGDNQFKQYNEPEVMKQTLVNTFLIPEENVYADYAGRRTFDTCKRAHDLWGIERAVLISQGYHLPRAIWTCEALGIESSGVSATLQPYMKETLFKLREIAAIYNAFLDLYVLTPSYLEGPFIKNLDEKEII